MDSLDLTKRIQELEAQIQATKEVQRQSILHPLTTPPPAVTPPVPAILDPSQAEAALRKLIQEEIVRVTGSVSSTVPPQAEPMDYGHKLLYAIGLALNDEQQMWLSKPENQADIPEFLSTQEGQALVKRFLLFYKLYKEKQCK